MSGDGQDATNEKEEAHLPLTSLDDCAAGGVVGEVNDHEQLLQHISELQRSVSEMKLTFAAALRQLTEEKDEEQTTAELPDSTVYQLQNEMERVMGTVTRIEDDHERTKQLLQRVAGEKQHMLRELVKCGILSDKFTQQQQLGNTDTIASRSSSGCTSQDSGVAAAAVDKTICWSSDQDSEHAATCCSSNHSHHHPDDEEDDDVDGDREDESSEHSLTSVTAVEASCLVTTGADTASYVSGFSATERPGKTSLMTSPVSRANDPEMALKRPAGETDHESVVAELVDTERNYCRTLWTIQDVFANPLAVNNILTEHQFRLVFPGEIPALHEKHCRLLHALEERVKSGQRHPHVGDVLYTLLCRPQAGVLKLYSSYVRRFPGVLKNFCKLRHSSSNFANFLQCRQQLPECGGLDAAALLLAPVQRLPRYLLLLEQLLTAVQATSCAQQLQQERAALLHVKQLLAHFLRRLDDAADQNVQLRPKKQSICQSVGGGQSTSRGGGRCLTDGEEVCRYGELTERCPSSVGGCHEACRCRRHRHRRRSALRQTPGFRRHESPDAACACDKDGGGEEQCGMPYSAVLPHAATTSGCSYGRRRHGAHMPAVRRRGHYSHDTTARSRSQLWSARSAICLTSDIPSTSGQLPTDFRSPSSVGAASNSGVGSCVSENDHWRSLPRGHSMTALYSTCTSEVKKDATTHNYERRNVMDMLKSVFTLRKRRSRCGMLHINSNNNSWKTSEKDMIESHGNIYTAINYDDNAIYVAKTGTDADKHSVSHAAVTNV